MTDYLGTPVMEVHPDEAQDLSFLYVRLLEVFDDSLSVPTVFDLRKHPGRSMQYRWTFMGRAKHYALRQFLYTLRGRAKVIWLPTFAEDFKLTSSGSAGVSTINVARAGYADHDLLDLPWKYILIEHVSGAKSYHQITAASSSGGVVGIDTLTINPALAFDITPDTVRSISYLVTCRLDQDQVEILHVTDVDGVTQVAVTWAEADASAPHTTIPAPPPPLAPPPPPTVTPSPTPPPDDGGADDLVGDDAGSDGVGGDDGTEGDEAEGAAGSDEGVGSAGTGDDDDSA